LLIIMPACRWHIGCICRNPGLRIRARCAKAGVPAEISFKTKTHEAGSRRPAEFARCAHCLRSTYAHPEPWRCPRPVLLPRKSAYRRGARGRASGTILSGPRFGCAARKPSSVSKPDTDLQEIIFKKNNYGRCRKTSSSGGRTACSCPSQFLSPPTYKPTHRFVILALGRLISHKEKRSQI